MRANRLRALGIVAVLFLGVCAPLAQASPLYLMQEQQGNDVLLRYDGGVLTPVGTGTGFGDVRGLAYDASSGTLFGVSRTADRLITINLATGVGTAVSGNNYRPAGSNTAEITVDASGIMYGLGAVNMFSVGDLYTVDTSTGIASLVGSPGGTFSGLAISHSTGVLYGTSYDGHLFTIDTTNGNAAHVGQITGTPFQQGVARIAFDQSTGVLFGITSGNELVTIDLNTLAATSVIQFGGNAQIYSLDFLGATPSVPEPGVLLLFGAGLVALRAQRTPRR